MGEREGGKGKGWGRKKTEGAHFVQLVHCEFQFVDSLRPLYHVGLPLSRYVLDHHFHLVQHLSLVEPE